MRAGQEGAQGAGDSMSKSNWALAMRWRRIARGTKELGGEQGKKKEGDDRWLGRLRARVKRLGVQHLLEHAMRTVHVPACESYQSKRRAATDGEQLHVTVEK